jgi:uncharacterized RDD family membrane protein YckC
MNTPPPRPNPYAPPSADVGDGFERIGSGELASRGSRLGAASLDGLIGMIIAIPAGISAVPMITSLATGGTYPGATQLIQLWTSSWGGLITLMGAIVWAVLTIRFVAANGQTIGKRMVGIKVVRKDGSKASLARIFWLRNVVNTIPSLLPLIGYLYTLVDLLMIFGESHQCLHDRIADTIVVKA